MFHGSSVPCPGNDMISGSPSSLGRPRARFAPHAGNLFDSGVKPRSAQRLILVQRQPDIVDRRLIQVRAEQRAIRRLPGFAAGTERKIQRM